MISELLSTTVLIGILASRIRLATPYLYAAIGETFTLQAEVLRLGSRVASTRMSFLAADGKLLSTGAGAYIVS